MRASISIDSLTKKYGDVVAVDGLSLEVGEGELFGLLGPNGAGKTTTINVLCGILEPTSGHVTVGGHDVVKELSEVKEAIGVCPQDTAVYSFLTIRENIELFGKMHAMTNDRLEKNLEYVLEKMRLLEWANKRAGACSGGIKRRLNMAMGLIHDPEIVFLDEPTVGMDVQARHAVWDFIKELKTRNKTVVLTTHYIEEAEQLCDRVAIVDHGKLVALGTPTQLESKSKEKHLEDVFLKLTGSDVRGEE
jgi:ABC-2 type transport system ATP-binding protein